jgi:phage FluMu protein Com
LRAGWLIWKDSPQFVAASTQFFSRRAPFFLMPIRFNCKHCGQKLSVGSQRAGTKANCPRCKEIVRVPGDRPQEKPASKAALAASMLVISGEGAAVETAPPTVDAGHPEQTEIESPPLAGEYEPSIETSELVFDTAPSISTGGPEYIQQTDYNLVSFPRYVLYAQAGLLAAVAIICFTLGALMGGAFLSAPNVAAAGPVTVSGIVKVTEGVTTKADEGAVVFFLPQDSKNIDERAPVAGLRPRDSEPEGHHRGLTILKDIGAGYARTDKEGRYKITVPKGGKYFMLVISRAKVGTGADIGASKQKIARFFENANDLLTTQKYQFSAETLADGRKFDVSFE